MDFCTRHAIFDIEKEGKEELRLNVAFSREIGIDQAVVETSERKGKLIQIACIRALKLLCRERNTIIFLHLRIMNMTWPL